MLRRFWIFGSGRKKPVATGTCFVLARAAKGDVESDSITCFTPWLDHAIFAVSSLLIGIFLIIGNTPQVVGGHTNNKHANKVHQRIPNSNSNASKPTTTVKKTGLLLIEISSGNQPHPSRVLDGILMLINKPSERFVPDLQWWEQSNQFCW